MKISGICHTGVCVRNLEKSIEFYNGILGFKVVDPPCDMVTDPEEGKGLGFEDCTHRICLLEVAPGQCMELMEFGIPQSPIQEPLPMNALGKMHLSLGVDDVQAWVDKFEELGLEVVYKPLPYETDKGTAYWVLVKDPDGIVIELMQE